MNYLLYLIWNILSSFKWSQVINLYNINFYQLHDIKKYNYIIICTKMNQKFLVIKNL